MKYSKIIVPVLLATLWIGFSEFLRNNLLFKSTWVDHYNNLGLVFPTAPINGAIWMLWSLGFAVLTYFIALKYTLLQTTLISWLAGFVLMWLVIGNLSVLPIKILFFAVPLSFLEAFVASYIIKRFQSK